MCGARESAAFFAHHVAEIFQSAGCGIPFCWGSELSMRWKFERAADWKSALPSAPLAEHSD
jgi:hypothetical protein